MANNGWTEIKSGAKKKKKGKGGHGEKHSDRDPVPAAKREVKPTIYEQAERAGAEKKANIENAAKERSERRAAEATEAEDRVKQRLLKDVSRNKGKNTHKTKVKNFQSTKDTIANLDYKAINASYSKAKITFAGNSLEWIKAMAGEVQHQLSQCEMVDRDGSGDSRLESPLIHMDQDKQEFLINLIKDSDVQLTNFFQFLVHQTVMLRSDRSDGRNNGHSCVGVMLLIQLLIKMEANFRDQNQSIVLASLPEIFKVYKDSFPKDEKTLPVLAAYEQAVALPKVFLRIWKVFHFKLLLDERSSSAVQAAALGPMSTIFPSRKEDGKPDPALSPQQVLGRLIQNEALLSVNEFWHLLKLAFLPNMLKSNLEAKKEIQRIYPYLRELTVCTNITPYFVTLLPITDRMNPESLLTYKVLEFINLGLFRNPNLMMVMEEQYSKHPTAVINVLDHMARHLWGVDHSVSSRHHAELKACVVKLISKNAELLSKTASEKSYDEGSNVTEVHDRLVRCDVYLRSFAELLDDDGSGGSHPVLWTMLILSFLTFVMLLAHMGCRFHPPSSGFAMKSCKIMSELGVLNAVDEGYRALEPHVAHFEPHILAMVDGAQQNWLLAEPYLRPAITVAADGWEIVVARASDGYTVVAPHIEPVASAAAGYTAAGWAAMSPHFTAIWNEVFSAWAKNVSPTITTSAAAAASVWTDHLSPVIATGTDAAVSILGEARAAAGL